MAQLSQNHAMDAAFAASANGFAAVTSMAPVAFHRHLTSRTLFICPSCPRNLFSFPSASRCQQTLVCLSLVLFTGDMMVPQQSHSSWASTLTACGDFFPHELATAAAFPNPPSRPHVDDGTAESAAEGPVQCEERNSPHSFTEDDPSAKGPLSNFPFFKGYGGDKKTRGQSHKPPASSCPVDADADGQPPKRRGPKPDSKPALTRRQELNRQAQRTHRERKEMYIKALEQEVLRLKDVFGNTARERDAIAEENRRLKELLAAHGIPFDSNSPASVFQQMAGSSYGGSSRGSVSGSYHAGTASTGYTSPPPSMPARTAPGLPMQGIPPQHNQLQPAQTGMDYDQIGIDFVLTLEKPCMEHMQFLLVRAEDNEADVSGHALMQTCPPHSHIAQNPEEKYPHKMLDVSQPDLMKLLDLSHRLPTMEGEITPVMAWVSIIQDPRFPELVKEDIEAVKNDLLAKVRCYGFGAVIEEFEIRDALNSVLAAKGQIGAAGPALE
ncbi:bzip-type transcription factor [Diplodia corticola]|uniref:Bzip-type transcription factor n=1 Tax=Diplodia corticola TaxID=236234 RepID=A0A1J9QXK0_9PEZI|nr:bzip-type transcription factor [Diplodia corticola]OJD33758.1 bzip-type transcription factor [Diplodia corticola]